MAAQPKRILVVEDEPFVRHDLCDFFEDRGFEVLAAGTADEALRIIEEQPAFGAVLTDIDMPGSIDGLRLAHMVKERHPPTIVVVASGVTVSTRPTVRKWVFSK